MEWDAIPYQELVFTGEKLGAGSFGVVMKGTYLDIEVAIKEVLPSTDYEVSKYFEREWRIMKEARHPNVVLYLGLSRGPPPDNKIYIISEFIDNGNLRSYIWDTRSHPTFPWRLRLSFATDISRALAYLHARKCIHRDLKGENLLLTANERVKMTDFGFARIAARNEEEMRRMSYCGTDGYMSPEILLGNEFDLPTDVFSLGIIFCEIISRRLVDSTTFKRTIPEFSINPDEVHQLASPGCPPGFIQLALDCLLVDPAALPKMDEVLARLRALELEVLTRGLDTEHVGSLRLVKPSTRPGIGNGKRIPSFGQGVAVVPVKPTATDDESSAGEDEDDDSDRVGEIVSGTGTIKFNRGQAPAAAGGGGGTWRTATFAEPEAETSEYSDASEMRGHKHLLSESTSGTSSASTTPSAMPGYSTMVVKARATPLLPSSSGPSAMQGVSSLTLKDVHVKPNEPPSPSTATNGTVPTIGHLPDIPSEAHPSPISTLPASSSSAMSVDGHSALVVGGVHPATPAPHATPLGPSMILRPSPVLAAPPQTSTAPVPAQPTPRSTTSPAVSAAAAARASEAAFTHRFTFVKPAAGAQNGALGLAWFTSVGVNAVGGNSSGLGDGKGKCGVCKNRIKSNAAFLACDDCGLKCHVKCSASATRNCGAATSPRSPGFKK